MILAHVITKEAMFDQIEILRILHECSRLIEFIKRVWEKEIKCEAGQAFYLFFSMS